MEDLIFFNAKSQFFDIKGAFFFIDFDIMFAFPKKTPEFQNVFLVENNFFALSKLGFSMKLLTSISFFEKGFGLSFIYPYEVEGKLGIIPSVIQLLISFNRTI